MTSRSACAALAVAGFALSLLMSACGSGGLSASSSCHDFMDASPTEQHEIIDQLAGQYNKADFATPLGEPEVPYYCTANPSVTLGQFFQKAEG
jgi:hypothetical protein